MKDCILGAVLFIVIYSITAECRAETYEYSPLAWSECLPRSWDEIQGHVDRDEWRAIQAITRNGRSKGLVGIAHVSDSETAAGVFHLTLETERFMARRRPAHAPLNRKEIWDARAVLYSDEGLPRQVAAWRRIVAPVDRAARQAGCHRGQCRVVALALANSSPVMARRIGRQTQWEPAEMCAAYVEDRPTDHRRRRCIALGVL